MDNIQIKNEVNYRIYYTTCDQKNNVSNVWLAANFDNLDEAISKACKFVLNYKGPNTLVAARICFEADNNCINILQICGPHRIIIS